VVAQERLGRQPVTLTPLTDLDLALQKLAQLKMKRN
jgi:hypothetical protein